MARLTFLVFLGLLGCNKGYERGDCDAGYLKVDGECRLAVGPTCTGSGDCLSDKCVDNPAGGRFCTIGCSRHTDCPAGFLCPPETSACMPGVPPPPCQSGDDCEACKTCSAGSCVPEPGCTLCASDAVCGACSRCQAGECIAVAGCKPCTSDSECPACARCAEAGRCERRAGCLLCAGDPDCPGCFACVSLACAPIEGCGTTACFNDSECPSRTRCLLDALQAQNVCLPVGLPFGADCSRGRDPTCAGGVCLVEGSRATCSQTCTQRGRKPESPITSENRLAPRRFSDAVVQNADCPTPTLCAPDAECVWACREPDARPPGQTCARDADCPGGQRCSLVQMGGGLEARCIAPLLCASPDGAACGPDPRCETGLCTPEGFCSPVCSSQADCPPTFFCAELQFPAGPEPVCTSLQGIALAVGQECSDNGMCASLDCNLASPRGPRGRCTEACGAGGCPDRFACQATPEGDRCLPAVLPGSCEVDADCPVGSLCRIQASGAPACGLPNLGGSGPGEVCARDGECAHGLCLPEGRCASLCRSAEDCPEDVWCDVREFLRQDGERLWLRLCSPAPGSLALCRADSECAPPEVCRPQLNLWGTGLDGRCGFPGAGALLFEACDTGCASGLCVDGRCSALCAEDNDCPAGSTCGSGNVLTGPLSLPADVCRIEVRGPGEACPFGSISCDSGLCFQSPEGAYCSMNCSSDTDCSGFGLTCQVEGQAAICKR